MFTSCVVLWCVVSKTFPTLWLPAHRRLPRSSHNDYILIRAQRAECTLGIAQYWNCNVAGVIPIRSHAGCTRAMILVVNDRSSTTYGTCIPLRDISIRFWTRRRQQCTSPRPTHWEGVRHSSRVTSYSATCMLHAWHQLHTLRSINCILHWAISVTLVTVRRAGKR